MYSISVENQSAYSIFVENQSAYSIFAYNDVSDGIDIMVVLTASRRKSPQESEENHVAKYGMIRKRKGFKKNMRTTTADRAIPMESDATSSNAAPPRPTQTKPPQCGPILCNRTQSSRHPLQPNRIQSNPTPPNQIQTSRAQSKPIQTSLMHPNPTHINPDQ